MQMMRADRLVAGMSVFVYDTFLKIVRMENTVGDDGRAEVVAHYEYSALSVWLPSDFVLVGVL